MPRYPTLAAGNVSQQATDTFLGYNHNLKIGDGEFFDMENMTSDHFPMLASRRPRFLSARTYEALHAAAYKGGHLITICSEVENGMVVQKVYCDDMPVMNTPMKGDHPAREIISMGAYVIILPEWSYFNTAHLADCGTVEHRTRYAGHNGKTAYLALCDKEGNEYAVNKEMSTLFQQEPDRLAHPEDIGSDTDIYFFCFDDNGYTLLKRFDAKNGAFVTVKDVYMKIVSPGVGEGFSAGECVYISGDNYSNIYGKRTIAYVPEHSNDILVTDWPGAQIFGKNDENFYSALDFSITRAAPPDMDFVIPCQNRLWGCKYGIKVTGTDDSGNEITEIVNEIYCCALGNFKVWERYEGLSTDSYRASVGTDGPWTGAVTYNNQPHFFKQNYLHRVYVSAAGAHQIVEAPIKGVSKPGSLAQVNGALLYVGQTGVCVYDGGGAYEIGEALDGAPQRAYQVKGLALGNKYYAIVNNEAIFVYDTKRALWHRESLPVRESSDSDPWMIQFAASNDMQNEIMLMCGTQARMSPIYISEKDYSGAWGKYETVEWSAATGLMGYTDTKQKYVSRFSIRMALPAGSRADFWMQYDEGDWEKLMSLEGKGTRSFLLPIRPRRCDHFRFRISGSGEVRVYSIARDYEQGSDAVL